MRVVPRIMKRIRPGMQKCVPGRFARISRVRRRFRQDACLHAGLSETTYDEQREREMRSISSLLMRHKQSQKAVQTGHDIYRKVVKDHDNQKQVQRR